MTEPLTPERLRAIKRAAKAAEVVRQTGTPVVPAGLVAELLAELERTDAAIAVLVAHHDEVCPTGAAWAGVDCIAAIARHAARVRRGVV